MFNNRSKTQLSIFDFKTDFESKLDPNNRWVKLAQIMPWDEAIAEYGKSMSFKTGAKSIEARVVIGALIIKHIEGKDDRGTIELIAENPYMQFFLGFDHFHSHRVFDPSLFVHIRKRLGSEAFDRLNQVIIAKALKINNKPSESIPQSDDEQEHEDQDQHNQKDNTIQNKGKVQFDATVAPANIKFPTDLDLLNNGRESLEELLDVLCKSINIPSPRTYRREARKAFLNLSKKKRKSYKEVRQGIKKQLSYIKRNLNYIEKLVDKHCHILKALSKKQYRYLLIVSELYRQQKEMYDSKTHSISHRIVNIHQPHVRPMVRGKAAQNTEFGLKINVSLQAGFARINQSDFEAFNEGAFLIQQCDDYKQLNGFYPAYVQTDDIYMNRNNRAFLKQHNIAHTGRPLGRKPKQELPIAEKRKLKSLRAERNQIEGKFGQGKTKYKLNRIMTKLADTTKSAVAAIFFVMNLIKLREQIALIWVMKIIYTTISTIKHAQNTIQKNLMHSLSQNKQVHIETNNFPRLVW